MNGMRMIGFALIGVAVGIIQPEQPRSAIASTVLALAIALIIEGSST